MQNYCLLPGNIDVKEAQPHWRNPCVVDETIGEVCMITSQAKTLRRVNVLAVECMPGSRGFPGRLTFM